MKKKDTYEGWGPPPLWWDQFDWPPEFLKATKEEVLEKIEGKIRILEEKNKNSLTNSHGSRMIRALLSSILFLKKKNRKSQKGVAKSDALLFFYTGYGSIKTLWRH